MTTDVILNDAKGYWDFDWTDSGDLPTEETLDTAILLSIFEEARATAGEISPSHLRGGWLGNEAMPGFEMGSKAWLFKQERLTASVLADLGPIVRNAMQWFIDDGIMSNVEVETPAIRNGNVSVFVNIFRDGSRVDRRHFNLWKNTGNF